MTSKVDREVSEDTSLFRVLYFRGKERSQRNDADRAILSLKRYIGGSSSVEFKLPRDRATMTMIMNMLTGAHFIGREEAREDIRSALGIKECHGNDG